MLSLVVAGLSLGGCSGDGLRGLEPTAVTVTAATTTSSGQNSPFNPWALPGDHEVPSARGAFGAFPSFNESPGCDGPQGIRGPFASTRGKLAEGNAVRGPWGDYFGRDIAEVRSHLVAMELPNGAGTPVTVFIHDRVVPALQNVIDNLLLEQQRGNVYRIDYATTSSFYPATIPPGRYLSFHAMGIAVDVNSVANPYRADNVLVTDMPSWFVKAWTDAGWCWGGSWRDIKDPMHFSWKGPRYTPDYPVFPPMPVRTDSAPFDRVVALETALGVTDEGTSTLIGDIDRDGASDLVAVSVQRGTGRLDVLVARAIHRFDTCLALGPTPYPPGEDITVLLADVDGDDRPDLWVIGPDGGTTAVLVYTHGSGYTEHLPVRHTSVPAAPRSVYLGGDFDADGAVDLWVLDPGAAKLEVWAGPEFEQRLITVELPADVDLSWRFAAGDRDGDGRPDLFALGPDRLVVLSGGDLLGELEEVATPASAQPGRVFADDFDGDGRADLYILGDAGSVRVYLGGERTVGDRALMSWFLELDDRPWEYREGCPVDPTTPR